MEEGFANLNRIAFLDGYGNDRPCPVGTDLGLHLHGFQNDNHIAVIHCLTSLAAYSYNCSRQR